jgi:hypothetical protein
MSGLFKSIMGRLAAYTLTYIALQIVTGVEVAIGAVALVLGAGWNMPAALSFATAAGFPLLLLQGAAAIAFHEGYLFPRVSKRGADRKARAAVATSEPNPNRDSAVDAVVAV